MNATTKKQAKDRKKTRADIEQIREVQKAAEEALGSVLLYLKEDKAPTADRAHEIIDEVLAVHDCESPHGHIVAYGPKNVEPHEHGSGPIPRGVSIVIDIYPRSKKTGYYADMTRTVCIGEPTDPEIARMYQAVDEAQELTRAMVRSGVSCSELHIAADEHFKKLGYKTSGKGKEFHYAEGFVHALGHGVGQDIHERPVLAPKSPDVLEEGDVVTLEPGLYYKGIGGIRLEDMVYVTKDGCETLTNALKQFVI